MLTPSGFSFDPVEGNVLDLVAYGGGDGVASTSTQAEPTDNGGLRFFGDGLDVSEPIEVNFTGSDRSISVTYLRPDDPVLKWCRVRE